MNNLINMLNDFFTFIIAQLGNIGNFFISNPIGIIIIAVSLFYVIADVVFSFINKSK